MFGPDHYVPVLRWKRGERWALRQIADADRPWITPLIELVPSDFDPGRRRRPIPAPAILAAGIEAVEKAWGRRPFFLDLHLLPPGLRIGERQPWVAVVEMLRDRDMRCIPVCALGQRSPHRRAAQDAARTLRHGAALRVFVSELFESELQHRVDRWLSSLGVGPNEVDLILDFQVVGEGGVPTAQLCDRVPHVQRWRTFTLLAGAFPPDLQGFAPGVRVLSREDWGMWRQVIVSAGVQRPPAFGDYTVQHAQFRESPLGANFSASIRYAADEHWVIMRGEGVRNQGSAGYAQWPANAMLLVERPEFQGEDFSAGDAYIVERTRNPRQPGNPETWIRAGINHHMALTARQIASLAAA